MSRHFLRFLMSFIALTLAPGFLAAQLLPGAGRSDYARLTPKQADEHLAAFRNAKLSGDFCFRIAIVHQQRRADAETVYHGTLWGTWGNGGPLFRLELQNTSGTPGQALRLILQSGPNPELWVVGANGTPVRSTESSLTPLFPGLIFTPFELQTPFTYWPGAQYVKTADFRGRPTHTFKMTPPPAFPKDTLGVSHVELGFDRAYNALMQAVIFDTAGKPLRQLSAESFRKVQEQYIPEEIRLRDEKTRNRDIFRVTAAALNLRLPRSVFDPATLTSPAPVLAESHFTTLD